MPKGFSSNLDFLRATAVLLVLAQHLTRYSLGESARRIPSSYLGLFGVLLFFVHTSLVLMYSMERSQLRGLGFVQDFYIRRFFRIYPLSTLTIAAALILHLDSNVSGVAGLSHGPLPSVKAAIAQFLLLQNLFHIKSIVNVLWSLPYEVQMYLFLPFLFLWVRGRRAFWALLTLWMVSMFGAWVQPHIWWLDRASLLRFIPCFLPGVIAFTLPHTPRLRSFLWPLFIIGLIAAYTLKPSDAMGSGLCLLLGLGIPFFQEIEAKWLRVISNRIATYSYGIYLSHQFCIWFALGVLSGYSLWLRVGVLVGLLMLLPVALYHGLERPMIGVGMRLAAHMREKAVEALPVAA